MTGKPLLLVHHHICENLGYLYISGKLFYLKMLRTSAWIAYIVFLPIYYPPYSNSYWVSHRRFWIQHQVTHQFKVTSPCLIKYLHHHINPIHMSGSFYLFQGMLLFCSILFSSVHSLKHLIDFFLTIFVGKFIYASMFLTDVFLNIKQKVRHNIFILHNDYKLLSLLIYFCHTHPSQVYYSYLLFIFEVKLPTKRINNNKIKFKYNVL